jgi:hypothetical protein
MNEAKLAAVLSAHNPEYRMRLSRRESDRQLRVRAPKIPDGLDQPSVVTPNICKYELPVLQTYSGPPCKRAAWSVRGCEKHGRCVRKRGTSVHSCDQCEDFVPTFGPWKFISKAKAKRYAGELKGLVDNYLGNLAPYKPASQPRGIIVSGGGKYYTSSYITIRAIRHQDSDIPVELWYYNDEYSEDYERVLAPYNVKFVNATKLGASLGARFLGKYAIKTFAVRHCDYDEVLHLDADSYPVAPISQLWENEEYQDTGAVFTHDIAQADNWYNAGLFHVPDIFPIAWETGQYLINRRVCWDVLNLAYIFDQYSDYTWTYGFGDTGTWRAAWAYHERAPTFFSERPIWQGATYIHVGPDRSTPLFVHRTRDKFRLMASAFYTRQHHGEVKYDENIPLEKQCFEWLEELRKAL